MLDKVKQLRSETGVGLGDCLKSLEACNDDVTEAKLWLRTKGRKLVGSVDSGQGIIGSYIHHNEQLAALVVVTCETDFAIPQLKEFAESIAIHLASTGCAYIRRTDIPNEIINTEESFQLSQVDGNPHADKIIAGRMSCFYRDNCLLEQPFVKDKSKTIGDMLADLAGRLNETIDIKQIIRVQI